MDLFCFDCSVDFPSEVFCEDCFADESSFELLFCFDCSELYKSIACDDTVAVSCISSVVLMSELVELFSAELSLTLF